MNNASKDPKLEELRETITEVAKQQSYWGELKPAKWIPFEKLLEDLRSKNIQVVRVSNVMSKPFPQRGRKSSVIKDFFFSVTSYFGDFHTSNTAGFGFCLEEFSF